MIATSPVARTVASPGRPHRPSPSKPPPLSAPLVKCPGVGCGRTLGQLVDGEIVSMVRVGSSGGGSRHRVFYARRVECEGCGGIVEVFDRYAVPTPAA